MKDLFEAFAQDPLLEPTGLVKVRSRVRETLKWLVNLSNELRVQSIRRHMNQPDADGEIHAYDSCSESYANTARQRSG